MSDRPTVPDVLPLVIAYCERPGNAVGGSLHIVLDEGNVHDDHVRFCIRSARERSDSYGEQLGVLLLAMSKTQRLKLSQRAWSA